MTNNKPSMDQWLQEAKEEESANKCGMYLFHNGVVRKTARARLREGKEDSKDVVSMFFDYDEDKVAQGIEKALQIQGIYYVKVWMAQGELQVGDDIMMVLIGGDIRPNIISALEKLLGYLKSQCVIEREKYD